MQKLKLIIVGVFLTYSTFLLASDLMEDFDKKTVKTKTTQSE
jgi:hypothetical protein